MLYDNPGYSGAPMNRLLLLLLFTSLFLHGFSQHNEKPTTLIDFQIPDTVCVDVPFTITNLSQGASTYYWSFCTGDAGDTPSGMPLISVPSLYSQPVYAALVNDNGELYSFITNMGNGTITRNDHHHNMLVPPVNQVNLGVSSNLNNNLRGIQVKKDNGNWYGFVADGNIILRLDFGTSLLNNPTYHLYPGLLDTLNRLNGIEIVNDGTNWVGFCTNMNGNSLTRLFWGSSLANPATATNLGNIGTTNIPSQLALIKKDTNWYIMIANEGDNTLSWLSFGNSLLNNITGINLGNVGGLNQDEGICLIRDCEALNGFVVNNVTGNNVLTRLNFPQDIGGPGPLVTGQSIGNIGSLNQPATFSEAIRIGDTLYTLVTNPGNSTISLLYFPSCTNASIPSSTLKDPPAISYSAPGQYNIMLVTDEGLPTQQNICKRITVSSSTTINIGNDTLVCSGKMMTLDAGPGRRHYHWSNGDTTRTIQVNKPGKYWVQVTISWNCQASDTIVINQLPPVSSALDTTICYGVKYFAGGGLQTTAGTYIDTLQTAEGCDSIKITNLSVKPRIPVDIGSNRSICPGETITLHATVSNATYAWQDGTVDSLYTVTQPGIYWVEVTYNQCTAGDTVHITECPAELWFPTAFSPNGDGTNDVFRPRGISIASFHMEIFNRWGQMIFETSDIEKGWDGTTRGSISEAGTYSFVATYTGNDDPGTKKKKQGSFILVK